MNAEIISPMTDAEKAQERILIDKILAGINKQSEAQESIIAAIIEIKDKKLWRQYGSIEEWTERAVGISPRMVNYYITAAGVTKQLKAADPNFKGDIPVTHANLLARFEENDQAELWKKANEAAQERKSKLTTKLMGEIANQLEKAGKIKLRDGVSAPNPNHIPHTPDRIKMGWFQLVGMDRAETFNHIVNNETHDFLMVMQAMITKRLEELGDETDDEHDDDSE